MTTLVVLLLADAGGVPHGSIACPPVTTKARKTVKKASAVASGCVRLQLHRRRISKQDTDSGQRGQPHLLVVLAGRSHAPLASSKKSSKTPFPRAKALQTRRQGTPQEKEAPMCGRCPPRRCKSPSHAPFFFTLTLLLSRLPPCWLTGLWAGGLGDTPKWANARRYSWTLATGDDVFLLSFLCFLSFHSVSSPSSYSPFRPFRLDHSV